MPLVKNLRRFAVIIRAWAVGTTNYSGFSRYVATSYIRYVIGALLGGEFRERLGDGFDEYIECPRRGLPRGFQLCKGLFDRVQVGTVVGQIAQRRASSLNRL